MNEELFRFVCQIWLYPGRKFTPTVILSTAMMKLQLLNTMDGNAASFPGHDAEDAEGRQWQIKATGGRSIDITPALIGCCY